MDLRKLRIGLLLYAAFDLLIGGVCGGLLPLSQLAAAQFTVVSGTVTDPNSLPYANGTITATLVSSGTPKFTATNQPYTPPTQPVGLSAAGSFVMQLADNTQLTPGGSTWTFTVTCGAGCVPLALGKGQVSFTVTGVTISGASQSITATLTAAAPALTTVVGGGGSGTVSSGTATQIGYYSAGGTTISSNPRFTDNGSTLGYTGATGINIAGGLVAAGAVSGASGAFTGIVSGASFSWTGNVGAHTFFGNNTGGAGPPSPVTIGLGDLPNSVPSTAAGTTNFFPKYTATGLPSTMGNSLVSDNGTTLTYTGTGGFSTPGLTSTDQTAGLLPVPFSGTLRMTPDPGEVYAKEITGATADVSLNTALLTGNSAFGVIVNFEGFVGSVSFAASPFTGFTGGSCLVEQGFSTVVTDVTVSLPNKCSWVGPFRGDPGSTGAVIQASANFQTNFPTINPGAGTATICFQTGSNTVIAGTNVAGTCTSGGTATFPANSVGYAFGICPSGATCAPNNTIFIGVVSAFNSSTNLSLEVNVPNPITIPATGTGYQFVMVRPLVRPGLQNVGGCPTGTSCIGFQQKFTNITIDCNDGTGAAPNQHLGYLNISGQEGTALDGTSRIRNCGWHYAYIGNTQAQNSGPYTFDGGSNAGFTSTTLIPVKIWQVGSWRGLMNGSISTAPVEAVNIQYINTINGGGGSILNYHGESATDHIECGDTVQWPWVGGGTNPGTGCSGTVFNGNTGQSNITNVYHIMQALGSPSQGDAFCGISKQNATNVIANDYYSQTLTGNNGLTFPSCYTEGPIYTDGMVVDRTLCTSVTPVTVSANVSTDQLLMVCTIPPQIMNVVGRTLAIYAAGVYSTPAASTSAMTIKAKLCSVSGCGSGTIIPLANITSAALGTIQATNDPWNYRIETTSAANGTSSNYESHGNLIMDLGATTSTPASVFPDQETGVRGNIDATATMYLQITGAFSNASASNTMTQRQLTVRVSN